MVEAPLDDLKQVTRTDIMPNAIFTDVLVPTPGGDVAVAQHGPNLDLFLWWPRAGGVPAARNLGNGRYPSGVALSNDAVALAYPGAADGVFFTVQTTGD